MYKFVQPNLNKDEILWESLVTIKTTQDEYSSHIVRLYKDLNSDRYYVFFRPDKDCMFSQLDWSLNLDNSWGNTIMNYSYKDYEELRKRIYFNDDIPIYQVFCSYKEFADNKFDSLQIVSPKYRA